MTTDSSGTRWTVELRRFLREFAAFAGRRGVAAAAYVAAGAVLEGLGLFLIVPLLGIVIGVPQGGSLEVMTKPLWLWRRVSA